MNQTIQYRVAEKTDRVGIIALLKSCGLPTSDIETANIDFIVAPGNDKKIAGCIGVERFGADGLLRSFAVSPDLRNQKLGNSLYNRLLSYSGQSGIQTLHLLTTSAEQYFKTRGFVTLKREAASAIIRATAEFSSLCPSSSAYMRLDGINELPLVYYEDVRLLQTDRETGSPYWSLQGKNLQFTSFDIPANTRFEKHHHDSEQITYVLEGELFFETGNTIHQLCKGDSIVIPGEREHGVWTGSLPAKAVDAWSPVNKKYNSNQ